MVRHKSRLWQISCIIIIKTIIQAPSGSNMGSKTGIPTQSPCARAAYKQNVRIFCLKAIHSFLGGKKLANQTEASSSIYRVFCYKEYSFSPATKSQTGDQTRSKLQLQQPAQNPHLIRSHQNYLHQPNLPKPKPRPHPHQTT